MPSIVRVGWAGCAVFLALLSCYLWDGPDIFFHLFLGRRILETGQVQPQDLLILRQSGFINLYWLFQLVVTSIYKLAQVPGVTAFFFAVWLGTLYVWARTVKALDMGGYGTGMGLIAIVIFATRFEPRPEIISYLICALQIFWLSTWDWDDPLPVRQYAIFAVSEALWANVQGYFVLGPALVGAKLLSTSIAGLSVAARRRLLVLMGVTLAASICSPLGWGTWNFVWTLTRFLNDMHGIIQEFKAPIGDFLQMWIVWVFWISWVGTIGLGIVHFRRKRRETFPLILAAAGLYLGATAYRNIPLFMIMVGPLWSLPHEMLSKRAREHRSPAWLTLGVTLGLCLWIVSGGYYRSLRSEKSFGLGLSRFAYPVDFCTWLGKPTGGRLFNHDSDGGYLEFQLPGQRLYIDSRFTDTRKVLGYFSTSNAPERFFALQAAERFDGALLRVRDNNQLISALLQSPRWKLVYTDLHRAYLANRDSNPSAYPPPPERQFYRGEDLSLRVNAMSASVWIMILARADQRQLLVQAIDELSGAPRIPSFVLEFALTWAVQRRDSAVFARVSALRPKMLSFQQADQDEVDRLLKTRW